MGVHVQPQAVLGEWPRAVSELTVRLGYLYSPGLPEYHSTGVVFQSLPCCAKEEVPLPPERDLPSHRHPSCGVGGSIPFCVWTMCVHFSSQNSFHSWLSGGFLEWRCLSKPPNPDSSPGPELEGLGRASPGPLGTKPIASAAPFLSLSLEKYFPPARPGAGHVSSGRGQGSGI